MNRPAAGAVRVAPSDHALNDGLKKTLGQSVLSQLLHALNQPLTGLQCSMEVALVHPRTIEQYLQGLREGLELTERMRGLVEAIREVADIEEEHKPHIEMPELASLLRDAAEELRPVAEVKNVRIELDVAPAALAEVIGDRSMEERSNEERSTEERSQLARAIFRVLDSTLSLAASATVLRINSSSATSPLWLRIQWQAEARPAAFSRPELGLLVARAFLERAGAEWDREAKDNLETLRVQLPPRFSP
jgi:signal transduction histidine kinase